MTEPGQGLQVDGTPENPVWSGAEGARRFPVNLSGKRTEKRFSVPVGGDFVFFGGV